MKRLGLWTLGELVRMQTEAGKSDEDKVLGSWKRSDLGKRTGLILFEGALLPPSFFPRLSIGILCCYLLFLPVLVALCGIL